MLILMYTVFGNLQAETDPGTPIPEVSGLLQYCVTKDAIGKFISFQCTPVRDDGSVGEPRTCMGQERVRPGNLITLCLKICLLVLNELKISILYLMRII